MNDVKFYMSDLSVKIKSESLVEEAVQLMKKEQVGSIMVTQDKEIIGIFTETDLLRKVVAEGIATNQAKVASVMSSPLVSIDSSGSMVQAFLMMQQRNIRHLGVTENKKIIGVISIKDIANYYVNKFGKKK